MWSSTTLVLVLFSNIAFAQSPTIPGIPIPQPSPHQQAGTEDISRYLEKLKTDANARAALDRQLAVRRRHVKRSYRAEQRMRAKREKVRRARYRSEEHRATAIGMVSLQLEQLRSNREIDQYRIWFFKKVKQALQGGRVDATSPAVVALRDESKAKRAALSRSIQERLTALQALAQAPGFQRQVSALKAHAKQKLSE